MAKALVQALVGTALATLVEAGGVAGLLLSGRMSASSWVGDPTLWFACASTLVGCAAMAVLGTAVGLLCRRGLAAVGVLIALLVLSPALLGIAGRTIPALEGPARWLPMQVLNSLTEQGSAFESGVPWWAAALALFAWAAVPLTVAAVVLRRTDL